MFKKVSICFISLLMVFMPISAHAEELQGKVTSLSLGEEAPYSGVLLDSIAASKMVVDKKYLRLETELELRKEFQSELSSKRLAYDLLKVEYDSLNRIHEETLLLKNQQISDLNILLQEEMGNDYAEWWMLGGVAVGILLSVAVFYASVEISR